MDDNELDKKIFFVARPFEAQEEQQKSGEKESSLGRSITEMHFYDEQETEKSITYIRFKRRAIFNCDGQAYREIVIMVDVTDKILCD